jgi:hypothetical protein
MMTNSEPRFTTTSLQDIGEIAVAGVRWKPLRHTLGITAFGTNAYVADAGELVVEEHDEQADDGGPGHQEMYVVVTGAARFTLDGEDRDLTAGSVVFLRDLTIVRKAVALQDGTMVLAVGAAPGVPFTVSEWEDRFFAEGEAAT